MEDKLIFISCGQQTQAEKELGSSVKQVVDTTPGFEAYFAEYVQSLEALSTNVYRGLQTCAGLVCFLHDRGKVVGIDGQELGHRSSVWVNQELAILAYRELVNAVRIPILVFKDPKVWLEGAMTSLIVNAIDLQPQALILKRVRAWLRESDFASNSGSEERFRSAWGKLSPTARIVLCGLVDLGGSDVKEGAIRVCLRERYGLCQNEAAKAVTDAGLEFTNTDLVKRKRDIFSGDEMTLNPTWQWHIRRALREGRVCELGAPTAPSITAN